MPLPPQEAYGMNYDITAEGSSVVYLGVKVYFQDRGGVHTTVYDREFSYPYHIVRYDEFTSVAPRQAVWWCDNGPPGELSGNMFSYERYLGICWDGVS